MMAIAMNEPGVLKEMPVNGAFLMMNNSKRKDTDGSAGEPPKKKTQRTPRLPPGFTAQAFEKTDPVALRKGLKRYVKTMAGMVDADWHDGYEEQGEEACAWFRSMEAPLRAICSVVENNGTNLTGYRRLNKALLVMADSWVDINAIPFRCDPGEAITDSDTVIVLTNPKKKGDVKGQQAGTGAGATTGREGLGGYDSDDEYEEGSTSSPDTAFTIVWSLLLHCAVSDPKIQDVEIYRYIKDAAEYGAIRVKDASKQQDEGDRRLAALYAKKDEWNGLKSNYKVHRMRRAIDRRFDGPKHLRTRDFGDDDDYDDCIIS